MKQFLNLCFYFFSALSIYACHESNSSLHKNLLNVSNTHNNLASHFIEYSDLQWINYSQNDYYLSLDLPKEKKITSIDDLANIYMVCKNGYQLETIPILSDYKFDLQLNDNKLILYYHTQGNAHPPKPEKIKVELFM